MVDDNSVAQFEGLYVEPILEVIGDGVPPAKPAQDLLNSDEAVNDAFLTWITLGLPDNTGRTMIKKELGNLTKPQSMDVVTYLSQMSEINGMIRPCPDSQTSSDTELIEIVEDNIPAATWAMRFVPRRRTTIKPPGPACWRIISEIVGNLFCGHPRKFRKAFRRDVNHYPPWGQLFSIHSNGIGTCSSSRHIPISEDG